MISQGPFVRVIYQFTCSNCGRETFERWPYNPMSGVPSLEEVIPEGWTFVIEGSHKQTPKMDCGGCK